MAGTGLVNASVVWDAVVRASGGGTACAGPITACARTHAQPSRVRETYRMGGREDGVPATLMSAVEILLGCSS